MTSYDYQNLSAERQAGIRQKHLGVTMDLNALLSILRKSVDLPPTPPRPDVAATSPKWDKYKTPEDVARAEIQGEITSEEADRVMTEKFKAKVKK